MVKRNIIILPPPEATRQAIAWSQDIANRYPVSFVLDGKNFYPHITLFQGEYVQTNEASLEKFLVRTVSQMQSFSVRLNRFGSLDTFIFLNAERDESLISLQKTIFETAKTLGRSLSPIAGDIFVPHITLTRLKNAENIEMVPDGFGKPNVSFRVSSLYLANIGPNGSVNEIFREFPFQMV